MRVFTWDPHKNEKLIQERGISFETIVWAIQAGGLLDITEHPDPQKYPGQKHFVVQALEYVYVVPFEERDEEVRLITIIPSRKVLRKYRNRGGTHET